MRHDRRLKRFLTPLLFGVSVYAHAGPQIFTPQIQQCDGSYVSGATSRRPNPLVRAVMQDTDAVGLKTGQQPSDFYSTIRLGERFGDSYRVEASSCATVGATGRQTWAWYYADTSASGAPDQGLLGVYFDNIDFSNLKVLRIDATVDQTPGTGAPSPTMGPDQYTQRWTGYVLPPTSGAYTFCTTASDGQRLYINMGGTLITLVDSWIDQVSTQFCSPTVVTLVAGQPYQLVFEHYQNCSSGVSCTSHPGNAHLQWSGPAPIGGVATVIAAAYLRPYQVPMIGRCSYSGTSCTNPALALDAPNSFNPAIGFSCPASTFSAPGTPSIPLVGPTAVPSLAAPYDAANKAFTFNGVNNSAKMDLGAQWYLPPTYTISAWIKKPIGTLAGAQRIVSQQVGSHYWLFRLNAGRIDVEDSREGEGAFGPGAQGPTLPDDGNWHFIAAARVNGTYWHYFMDGATAFTGIAASSVTQIMGLTSADNAAASAFIGSLGGTSEFFNGAIDELRIYPGQIQDDTLLMEYAANAYRYSANGGATFGVSTAPYFGGTPANGTQGLATLAPSPGTNSNSQFSFVAQSSDGLSTITGPTYAVTIDQSPPAAPSLTATPLASNQIQWTFASGSVCNDGTQYFTLFESSTGINEGNTAPAAATLTETYVEPPNVSHCRRGATHDIYGQGPLGPHTTAYTLPADPTGLTSTAAGPTSISLQWNANGNPTYTRYELSMSGNNFLAPNDVSTPIVVSANYTGTTYVATGLSPGTPYYFRVRAINGRSSDLFGGQYSGFSNFSTFTNPVAPVVTSIVISNTRIDWHWKDVKGATNYNLYSAGAAAPFAVVPSPGVLNADVFYSSTGLLTNNIYGIQIQPVNTGNGPLSPATYAYTFALPPTTLAVTGVSTNSVSLLWDSGAAPPLNNPAYTYYEVAVATDPLFAVVVATVTTQQLNVTTAGLFPSSTYYARVRAFNGQQGTTAFQPALPPAVQVATVTNTNPDVSVSSGPPSAYVPPGNVLGLWQFDENGGTTARDSTNYANNGALTCLLTACVSTPTFTTGPAGLGSAVAVTGQTGSLVLINPAAQYEVTDAISLGAWANPNTPAMPNGAAIIAKGTFGAESFSLDVWGSRYRFLVKPGFALTAPALVDVGRWHRVLGTYDGANANLYIDGQLVAGPLAVAQPLITNQCAASACPLVIGNRKSVTTAYDLGFQGGIDSALVVHRGLSAAEAAADYQGAFPTTTQLPPPNQRVQLTLPPNAFGAPAQIYASNDPIGHPLKVDPAALANGLLNVPTGHALLAGSLIEIVPTVGGQAFTLPLGSSATITLPYNDANGDAIIDGSNPPISVNTLQIYTLDTTVGQWTLLPSGVDTANRVVNATTPHFSIFGIFGATTIGASLSQVRIYPIPWIVGSPGKFGAAALTFDKLPTRGLIRIFGLSGERVAELEFASQNAGKLLWDGHNKDGHPVASGLYFAYVKDSDTQGTAVIKFAIER